MDCPPKIKHFLWRLSQNTLALRKNLQRRGIKLDTSCCICQRLDEDGGHLFLKCKEVKKVWRELNLETVRCQLAECGSAKEMMELVLKMEPKMQLTVILLLWLWWDERNKFREEGRRRPALEVAYVTAALAAKFQATGAQSLLPDFRQNPKWTKPQQGNFKVNPDGAFDHRNGSRGWGFIIRDDQGAVVTAGAGKEQFLQSAFHAELLGCAAGLKAATQLGIRRIVLETDASLVITALEDDAYRLSAMSGITTELRLLLMTEFAYSKVYVCPRSCNKGADAIAAYVCKCSSDMSITWDDVPHFLEDLVTSDSAESDE